MTVRSCPQHYYPGYIFDLDGTIYLGNRLLDGAQRLLAALTQAGSRFVFVSNNPTVTRPQMAARLNRLGVPACEEQVINSTLVLARRLKETAPGCRVFPIGEGPLTDELIENGFQLSRPPEAVDYVIASFDRTFAYWKLQAAFDALRAGAQLIATNADRYCPVAGGGEPDAAAVIAAIEACTGSKVQEVFGKPSLKMAQAALERLRLSPQECLLAGDRLETDILMGQAAGMDTALVLTGATPLSQLEGSAIRPNFVIDRIDRLIPAQALAEMGFGDGS